MTERVYLDWNASGHPRPEAKAAFAAALDVAGNASSIHAEGRAARRLIEDAREKVAALVGAQPALVTFTSGGTEANAMALTPALEVAGDKAPRDRLLISAVEHDSVLAGGRFPREAVERVPVKPDGIVDLAALAERMAVGKARGAARPLVSIMLANNETGVIQPIPQAAALVHEAGGLLHVDAVQAPGRIACDINALGADLLTLSAHKIGGPQGSGALVRRDESLHFGAPLVTGGGQERGLRAGTENVPGIAGFGAAAEAARSGWPEEAAHMRGLRDRVEAGLRDISVDAVIFGVKAERLPNTTFFAVPGIKAETALMLLDLEGVAVSSGAACSSGKVQPSHVLAAMGVDALLARGGVRVSVGRESTQRDVEAFLKAWKRLAESLGKRPRGIAA